MTDNEIKKALECCAGCNGSDCKDCPCQTMGSNCEGVSLKALDLINRQQAEIENLNIELQAMRGAANSYKAEAERYKGVIKLLEEDVRDAKTEAIKEFGHLFIDKAENGVIQAMDILDYVQEMEAD